MRANAINQSDTLVVYLSRTQNNKTLAEFIAQTIHSDLATLEPAIPYPRNYQLMRDQVVRELSDGTLPQLKNSLNIDRYQYIIIVFPTWAMQLPPPVKAFLSTHNMQGKTLMPLNTNAGYGVGSGFEDIKNLSPNAEIRTGLSLKGGNEREGNPFVMQGETLMQAQAQILAWLKNEKV